MDNTEDYRGLTDFANLATQAWNRTTARRPHIPRALAKIQSGIQNVLFIPSSGLYYTSFGAPAPNLSTWYPDAVAQIFSHRQWRNCADKHTGNRRIYRIQ